MSYPRIKLLPKVPELLFQVDMMKKIRPNLTGDKFEHQLQQISGTRQLANQFSWFENYLPLFSSVLKLRSSGPICSPSGKLECASEIKKIKRR